MKHILNPVCLFAALFLALTAPCASAQEIVSKTLTDAIYQGDGVINLLKDISAGELANYFNQSGGFLMLGADVNEQLG